MKTPSIHQRLADLDGIAHVSELALTATQSRRLRRAYARGLVLRPRLGIYALPSSTVDARRAAAIGGRLAATSALGRHGLWVPDPRVVPAVRFLHVEVSGTYRVEPMACAPLVSVVLWNRHAVGRPLGMQPMLETLRQCAELLPPAQAVAVLDSALRRTTLTRSGLLRAARSWALRTREVAARTDGRAESGTESILRILLADAGITAIPQPRIPTGDHHRADLLIGDRLLIECDSEAHHADPASRRADLRRDLHLQAIGFHVIRVDYRDLVDDPAGVIGLILAVVSRGEHLSAASAWTSDTPPRAPH